MVSQAVRRVRDVSSPARDRVASELRAVPAATEASIQDKRASIEAHASHRLDDWGYGRRDDHLDGIAVEWISPPGDGATGIDGSTDPVVVWLHGGGYVVCSIATHRERCGLLAAEVGVTGLIPEYRLAPEHPFPSGIEDCVAVCRALTRDGRPFLLAGDSAGGGLVLATMMTLRDRGDTLPLAALCISPWTDLTLSGDSLADRLDRDPFAHIDDLPGYVAAYLADADPRNPLASPLFADLSGLPPVLIQIGSDETMFDDATRLADALAAAGGTVELEEWIGMFHTWHAYAGRLEAADAAFVTAGRFLRRYL